MKKKLIIGFAAVMVTGMLAGCGSDDNKNESSQSTVVSTAEGSSASEETSRVNVSDFNTADYVTLGEYKNLSVAVTPITVTDEEVQAQALQIYLSFVT